MGEKDIVSKALEGYNDVFADIVNVLLFEGKQIISEDELEEATPYSHYKAEDKLHDQERDVSKYWKNSDIRIAFYGIENQIAPEADMPLRIMGYDGAAYRAQILADYEQIEDECGKKKTVKIPKPRYPVITLVLNFDHKKRWNKPVNLIDCLEIPDSLRPFVSDYRINVYDVAYLANEQVAKFKSDFRIVADYFVQRRNNSEYIPPEHVVKHVHEFLQFMAVMTREVRFEQVYSENMKDGEVTMCELIDKIENRGMERGLERGRREGISAFILEFLDEGFSRDRIIEKVIRRFEITNEDAEAYYNECCGAMV